MTEFKTGDILAEDAEALVNTVNCVGVMGRGIALQFKNAFPANFRNYEIACQRGEVQPGRMLVVETGRLDNPRFIINFPTKRHWRGKSRLADIREGLVSLVREIETRNIRSLAIPPLGAGLGGLRWTEVRPLIEKAFQPLESVRVIVFEPLGSAPTSNMAARSGSSPKMTPGRAVLIGLMDRYLAAFMDPFVTLLEVHKLMYLMQEAGEPLRLQYNKAGYGPYAENLRHVLKEIEGHLISGYGDGGDQPDKELKLMPGAIEAADELLIRHPGTRDRFCRVAELVQGFESSHSLELLTTVHWVAVHEEARSEDDTIKHVHAWNSRKKTLFPPREIRIARNALIERGWLHDI